MSGWADLTGPWQVVFEEAWAAFQAGSVPIGACVADAGGEIVARGRNRRDETRRLDGPTITGHRLGHAEMNALLTLPEWSAEEARAATLYSSVEPCPMCLGAMLMCRLHGLAYAAADPWAGHTEALHVTRYPRSKNVRVERAPEALARACTLLLLPYFPRSGMPSSHGLYSAFRAEVPGLIELALGAGATALDELRQCRAPAPQVYAVLTGLGQETSA